MLGLSPEVRQRLQKRIEQRIGVTWEAIAPERGVTSGLGHNRTLRDTEVLRRALEFLERPSGAADEDADTEAVG